MAPLTKGLQGSACGLSSWLKLAEPPAGGIERYLQHREHPRVCGSSVQLPETVAAPENSFLSRSSHYMLVGTQSGQYRTLAAGEIRLDPRLGENPQECSETSEKSQVLKYAHKHPTCLGHASWSTHFADIILGYVIECSVGRHPEEFEGHNSW